MNGSAGIANIVVRSSDELEGYLRSGIAQLLIALILLLKSRIVLKIEDMRSEKDSKILTFIADYVGLLNFKTPKYL